MKDQDAALDRYILSGSLALVPLLSMYADTPAEVALCGDAERGSPPRAAYA